MSERPIAVGDLVQVVRGCGCWNGSIFIVKTFIAYAPAVDCGKCAFSLSPAPTLAVSENWRLGKMLCAPLSWLKRIPPLSELEGVDTQENIREPA